MEWEVDDYFRAVEDKLEDRVEYKEIECEKYGAYQGQRRRTSEELLLIAEAIFKANKNRILNLTQLSKAHHCESKRLKAYLDKICPAHGYYLKREGKQYVIKKLT